MTWDDILAVGLGEIGLTPGVFWSLSLRQWLILQRGFFSAKQQQQQQEWERARYISFWVVRGWAQRGSVRKPGDIGAFPWDEVEKSEPLSTEELEKILLKYGKYTDGINWHN